MLFGTKKVVCVVEGFCVVPYLTGAACIVRVLVF